MNRWTKWGCLAFAVLTTVTAVQANSIRTVSGQVELVRSGKTLQAKEGMRVRQGDKIASKGQGEALLQFNDGARLALRTESSLQIKILGPESVDGPGQKTLKLLVGSLRYISGAATVRRKVSFQTNTATIGIRGTDIEITVSDEAVLDNNPGTYLKVNTGLAAITAPDGAQVEVAPGEVAYGGEPELTMRGAGGTRRASARKLQAGADRLFKASALDALMK